MKKPARKERVGEFGIIRDRLGFSSDPWQYLANSLAQNNAASNAVKPGREIQPVVLPRNMAAARWSKTIEMSDKSN